MLTVEGSMNPWETTKIMREKKFEDHYRKIQLADILTKLKGNYDRFLQNKERILGKKEIKLLFKGLELTTETDGEFKEFMVMVLDMLRVSVYLNRNLFEDYSDLFETAENPKLKKMISEDNFSRYPYYQVCRQLLDELRRRKKRSATELEYLNFVIRNMKIENEEKTALIEELNSKKDKKITPVESDTTLTVHKIYQLEDKLRAAQDEISELKEELNISRHNHQEAMEETYFYKMKFQDLDLETSKIRVKFEDLTQREYQMRLDYDQKIANYEIMKEQVKMCQDVMDRTIVKMSALKQEFVKVQREKDELVNERNEMAIRAAAGFEALTPRPDVHALIGERNLFGELSAALEKAEKKSHQTTIQNVEILLDKLQELSSRVMFLENERKDMRKRTSVPEQVGAKEKGKSGPKSSIMSSVSQPRSRQNNNLAQAVRSTPALSSTKKIEEKEKHSEAGSTPRSHEGDAYEEFLKEKNESKERTHHEPVVETKEENLTDDIINEIIEVKKTINEKKK